MDVDLLWCYFFRFSPMYACPFDIVPKVLHSRPDGLLSYLSSRDEEHSLHDILKCAAIFHTVT